MGAAAAATAPVTLRDFLELACESSCSDGFRSYPRRLPCDDDDALQAAAAAAAAPVRLLIEADLRRSPSRSLSSIFFPRSPRSLARISRLSRSLSRRLREGFWRRRCGDEIDERDSLGLPSPVVSSCSASEYAESEADDLLVAEQKSASESEKTSPSSSSSTGSHEHDAAGAAGDGEKAVDGDPVGRNQEMEDKQQLSPVSVMDFPFGDDDEEEEGSDVGTCSPSFHADLEGSKAQLLHKIRRFDGLAQVVDRVDLDARLAASEPGHTDDTQCTRCNSGAASPATPRSDEHRSIDQDEREPDEHRLLGRLLKDDDAAAASVDADEVTERLLLDFFAEGIDRRLRASLAGPVVGTVRPAALEDDHDEAALVGVAREWVQGAGPQWGVGDVLFAGEAALADMERPDGRRWMCVDAEERGVVGAVVEGLVMDALVAELVRDLRGSGTAWFS